MISTSYNSYLRYNIYVCKILIQEKKAKKYYVELDYNIHPSQLQAERNGRLLCVWNFYSGR